MKNVIQMRYMLQMGKECHQKFHHHQLQQE